MVNSVCLDGFSEIARTHAVQPCNYGQPEDFDGYALITGPCGETMEFWLSVQNGRILRAFFATDGYGSALACGSVTTCLVAGRDLTEAVAIGPEDVLEALGGLPEEGEHSASLAATTLAAACWDCLTHYDD